MGGHSKSHGRDLILTCSEHRSPPAAIFICIAEPEPTLESGVTSLVMAQTPPSSPIARDSPRMKCTFATTAPVPPMTMGPCSIRQLISTVICRGLCSDRYVRARSRRQQGHASGWQRYATDLAGKSSRSRISRRKSARSAAHSTHKPQACRQVELKMRSCDIFLLHVDSTGASRVSQGDRPAQYVRAAST